MALSRLFLTTILIISPIGVQAAVQPDKIVAQPAAFMIRWPVDRSFNPDQADLIKAWKIGKGSVSAVAFSADDRTIFAASHSGAVRAWSQVPDKFLPSKFQLRGQALNALAVSPDGNYIATGSGQTGVSTGIGIVQLWRWHGTKAELLYTLRQEGEMTALVFSSDSRYLLGSGRSGVGRIWERESARQVHVIQGHADTINDISFSADDEYILTGGVYDDIGILELWQWQERKKIVALGALKHTNAVNSIALSTEARYILAGGGSSAANGRNIALWKRLDGSLLHTFPQHRGWVRPVIFSADSEHVLSGGLDGSIKVWHRPRGTLLRATVADGEPIRTMAVSHNGRYLLAGSDKGTIRLRQAVFFDYNRLARHVHKQAVRYFKRFQDDLGLAFVAEPKLPRLVAVEPFRAESARNFQTRVHRVNKKHAKQMAIVKAHYSTQLKDRNTRADAFNTNASAYWSEALARSFADFCGQPRLAPGAGVAQKESQYVMPVQLTCTGIAPTLLKQAFVVASEQRKIVDALQAALMKKDAVAINTEWSVQGQQLVLEQAALVSRQPLALHSSTTASQFQLRLPDGRPANAQHQESVLAE